MATNGEPEKKEAKSDAHKAATQAPPEKPKPAVQAKVSPRVKAAGPPPAAPKPAVLPQAPEPSRVRLEVFCRLTGIKWDRLAAFKFYARKERLGPLPVRHWWAEFEKFQKRPVG